VQPRKSSSQTVTVSVPNRPYHGEPTRRQRNLARENFTFIVENQPTERQQTIHISNPIYMLHHLLYTIYYMCADRIGIFFGWVAEGVGFWGTTFIKLQQLQLFFSLFCLSLDDATAIFLLFSRGPSLSIGPSPSFNIFAIRFLHITLTKKIHVEYIESHMGETNSRSI